MKHALTLIALLLASTTSLAQIETKDVNAPPEDITAGYVRLPDPASCFVESASALLMLSELEEGRLRLDVGPGKSGAVLLGPDAEMWTLKTARPSVVLDDTRLVPGHAALGARLGMGETTIAVSPVIDGQDPGDRVALLVADGASETRLRSHADTHIRRVGEPLVIRSEAVGGVIVEGELHANGPDGRTVVVPMKMDGTASFVPEAEGDWSLRVRVRVLDAEGVRFRTTQDVIRVSTPVVELEGPARLEVADHGVHLVRVPARTTDRAARVIVAAELWGATREGADTPVTWLARAQEIDVESERTELTLGLDPAWIARAGVDPSTLHLREIRVHATSGASLLEHRARLAIEGAGDARPVAREPTHALPTGSAVRAIGSSGGARVTAGHVIMFSHGYCSGGNPFDVSDFSGDLATFLDTDQNRSHDEFALLIEERGRDVKSMGLVAHSQGGNAAAHLFTFYWSALDWAQGPRLIQTVGTPWQGTPLAGNVAVLGDIFGTGCGSNADLSTSGAPVWLSRIPTTTRQRVTYFTTAFEDRPFSFDFCQFASDLVLSDPDDGVIENSRGQLQGGNNGGFVEGWCHTEGMRDPAQCTDPSRNAQMNTEAAR